MLEKAHHPPQLCPMSQCDVSLDFSPATAWPSGLPAVAVNSFVLAGFSQELVFNHVLNSSRQEEIANLFRSLYSDLSFVEMARLCEKAANHSWFPLELVVQKCGWAPTPQFFEIGEEMRKAPADFQKWCADKRLGPNDLAPLLSARSLDLNFLYQEILHLNLSKSSGVKALELAIELLLMGQRPQHLVSADLLKYLSVTQNIGEAWVDALKQIRYPETYSRDRAEAARMTALPWPGAGHAKWVRQGDKTGVELKLFVSQPADLKKYLQSLNKVQDLLEKEMLEMEMKH